MAWSSTTDKILLEATFLALEAAANRRSDPEHAAARNVLAGLSRSARSRYRHGQRFSEDLISLLATEVPGCARFLRSELRCALDRRSQQLAAARNSILERSCEKDVFESWRNQGLLVSPGSFLRLGLKDKIDVLTLEIISVRGSDGLAPPSRWQQAAIVGALVRDLRKVDEAFDAVAIALWRYVTLLFPKPSSFESFVYQDEAPERSRVCQGSSGRAWRRCLRQDQVDALYQLDASDEPPAVSGILNALRR